MSYLPSNIKHLRKQKGLTQAGFAEKVGVNRSVVGAYEEGRADPRVKTLITISHFFKVGIDDLLKKDLSQKGTKSPKFDQGQLKILPVVVDHDNEELVPLVAQKAAAGYLNGYSDPEYIESLPLFKLPFNELPRGRTYRMFQIEGESMLPVPSSSIVIASYVENAKELREGSCYVFLTQEDGVVYKRLDSIDHNTGRLVLHSDNPEFGNLDVQLSDVIEAWDARGYVSLNIPKRGDYQPELKELSKTVNELKGQIMNLSKG